MANSSIEKMKKLIEDKKKNGFHQDLTGNTSNNWSGGSSKGFKNTKKGGSLNK